MIKDGEKYGHWVCLQNVHLSLSWVAFLDELIQAQKFKEVHADFRLWLTTMPEPEFSVNVL